jgi:hypothetical protein
MKSRVRFTGALLLALSVAACSHSSHLRVAVAGGDAGGLARALPADEHFDAAALERASDDSSARDLQAFIVLRHEHLVFERYGHGADAKTIVDSGGFARVLVALAAGVAVHEDAFPLPARSSFDPLQLRTAIEAASHRSYADYLSVNVWRRLNASPAWISIAANGAPLPADCCFHAQVMDWMRVADLLVNDGCFEGTQVLAADWVARMRRPTAADGKAGFGVELAPSAHGAEGFDAGDAFFVRGSGHWRLWLVPSLQLAILFGAPEQASSGGAPAWDETRLPNLVMRALSNRPAPSEHGSTLQQLVPGH